MNYIGKFIGVNGSSVTFELDEPFDITTARRKAGEGLIKAFIEVQDNDMISDDQRKKIFALINDICDHMEAVGAGRNRKKIDHSQHHFMALCRDHHNEQHAIGIDTFMKKYALVPIKLTPEQIAEFKIGG